MTEEQWNCCTDPDSMLEFIGGRASKRKLRLFGVACCRRVWHLMADPRHRDAIEAAERFADGLLTEEEFEEALQPIVALWPESSDARKGGWEPSHYMTAAIRHLDGGGAAAYAASFAARGLACLAGEEGSPSWLAACRAEESAQCDLIRDLFGNPSFPFRFDPAWLSGRGGAAVELARDIYPEGRFVDLPLLGNVLERAGCGDDKVLEHCRRPGPHAKGCWVLDALLGREPAVRTGLVTEADWRACIDPAPLLHFLRDKGSNRKWRLFAVACCRRIGRLITDERSRWAVEVATRFADDAASEAEREAARTAAQEAQDEAKWAEYAAEADANFRLTPAYAAACRRLYAAAAAHSAVCRDPRQTDAEPGSFEADSWGPSNEWAAAAVSEDVYANFGSEQDDARWEEARRAAESARAAELQAHCELLGDLFGEHLGPPGEEGDWLPSGLAMGAHPMSQAEQWCLLPTPRRLALRPEWLAWNDGVAVQLARTIYDTRRFEDMPVLADALEEAGCADAGLLGHIRSPGPHARGCFVLDQLLGKG
jgi:hypothetical protein